MDSSLYYTFSTIAQTLSAAIALLAAFALYRLQGISAILDSRSLELASAFQGNDHNTLQALRAGSRYDEFSVFMVDGEARSSLRAEPFASSRKTFEIARSTAAAVKSRLYWSLGLTVLVVVGSVFVLTIVPTIAKGAWAPFVLRTGIVGTALCLVAYVALVRATLK